MAEFSVNDKAGSSRPELHRQPHRKELSVANILEDYNKTRADALPLTKAANTNEFMSFFSWGDSNHDPQEKQTSKVSLSTLLSYSTRKEKWLMAFGILMVRPFKNLDVIIIFINMLLILSFLLFRQLLLVLVFLRG